MGRELRDQQRAAEARRRDRVAYDPKYAEKRRASQRAAAVRRREIRLADPVALAAYNDRRRLGLDLEKRRASQRRSDARRQQRLVLDFDYRAQRAAVVRASDQRRKQRRKVDPEYAEHLRAQARDWYHEQRERISAERRAIAAARGHEIRAYRRRKYAENPALVLARFRRWAERNPEKVGAWRRANDHRRRAVGPHFTPAEWQGLVARYRGACAYCGAPGKLEVDHVVPVSRGGSNSISNLLPACCRCNRRKGRLTRDEFLSRCASEARQEGTSAA